MQANTLADLILVTPSLAVPALLTYILQHPAYITQPLHPPPPPPPPPHTVELTHQLPWRWPPNSAPYLGQCRPWPPLQLFLPPKTGRGPEFHWGRWMSAGTCLSFSVPYFYKCQLDANWYIEVTQVRVCVCVCVCVRVQADLPPQAAIRESFFIQVYSVLRYVT